MGDLLKVSYDNIGGVFANWPDLSDGTEMPVYSSRMQTPTISRFKTINGNCYIQLEAKFNFDIPSSSTDFNTWSLVGTQNLLPSSTNKKVDWEIEIGDNKTEGLIRGFIIRNGRLDMTTNSYANLTGIDLSIKAIIYNV